MLGYWCYFVLAPFFLSGRGCEGGGGGFPILGWDFFSPLNFLAGTVQLLVRGNVCFEF